MDTGKRHRSFGQRLRDLVEEHNRMMLDKEAAAERAARNERARRQFLMFLLFAILAASVIYKDDIDAATASFYTQYVTGHPLHSAPTAELRPATRLSDIGRNTKQRQSALDEIEMGAVEGPHAAASAAVTNADEQQTADPR